MSHEAELENDLISIFEVLEFMRGLTPQRPTHPAPRHYARRLLTDLEREQAAEHAQLVRDMDYDDYTGDPNE